MARTIGIRVGLLRDVLLITLLLAGAVLGIGWHAARQAAGAFAGDLLAVVLDAGEAALASFLEPPLAALESIAAWDAAAPLGEGDSRALTTLLDPLPQVRALVVTDPRGGWRLAREASGWTRSELPAPAGVAGVAEGASPRWHAARPTADAPARIVASLARGARDGALTLELDLAALPRLASGPEVSAEVAVAVLDADRRLLRVPALGPLTERDARRAALLRRPDELGWPLLERARLAAGATRGAGARFTAGGETYWVAERGAAPAGGPAVTVLAVVAERRLLAALVDLQAWLAIAVAAVLALVALRVLALARRLSRPIEALAAESDRISRGDLGPGAPIESGVTEIQRLAEAHARMRAGLASLTRMEDSLQVARRIQQNTLPERIPFVRGFDIDAFSEPAEATGGDTYDIVGYRVDAAGRTAALSVEHADRALMLLADATGHGAGPALSATQVRAMLRMAVRTGAGLEQIVQHVNEQLCDDLHGGRFITAWLGVADAASGTLVSFSAGQAPLLHYHADTRRTERIAADTPPFGISRELPVPALRARTLHPGDVFAVLSDGIFEANDAAGAQFGEARAVEVIERHHAESAGLLVTRLRQALARFTTGVRAGDDRTAVVVRRESP